MKLDVHSQSAFERWEASQYRCLLDGVDISMDCFAADDEEGWADCYVRTPSGRVGFRGDKPATERRYGRVELFRKDAVGA